MPKNFVGGKSHKKFGGKVSRSERHNTEIATAFIEDVFAGEKDPEVDIGRVTKGYGGGRFDLLRSGGEEIKRATLRGVLTLRGKAGATNPVTIAANSFVVVHVSEHGSNIIAVLSQKEVAQLKEKLPAVKGFYEADTTAAEEGFEFDRATEEDDEELDVDAI